MTTRIALLLALAVFTGCDRAPVETDTDTDTDDTGDTSDTSDTGDTSDTSDTGSTTDCAVLPGGMQAFAGGISPTTLVTATPYTNMDTGLDTVVAAAAAASGKTTVSIAVTNVTVTQIGYTPDPTDVDDFWIADGEGRIKLYLGIGNGQSVVPGDIVSFTATEVDNYFGQNEITALSGFSVVSQGNPVHVQESNGVDLTFAAHGDYVHHVYGELTTLDSADCFGRACFTLEHTDGTNVRTLTFRVDNSRLNPALVPGDCVELYAPLETFESNPAFYIVDFDWFRWYGNSGAR